MAPRRLLLLATASAVAVAAALGGLGAAARRKAEPEPAAAVLALGGARTDAIEASFNDLCWLDFKNAPTTGPIGEQCEVQNAMRANGVRDVRFVGSIDAQQAWTPVRDIPLLQRAFCALQTNVGAVFSASTATDRMPNINELGRYVVSFFKRTPVVFFELVGRPVNVRVHAKSRGSHGTTLIELPVAPSVGAGTYAFAAAQPDGEFDQIEISGDGELVSGSGAVNQRPWCLQRVAVPCHTLPDDDDHDDACDDDSSSDRRKRSVLGGDDDDDDDDDDGKHRHPHDDDDDDQSQRAARSLTIKLTQHNGGERHDDHYDAYAGELCTVDFDSFDNGFSFEQFPHRLPHNGLAGISFRGNVDRFTAGRNLQFNDADTVTGAKAFCALAPDVGAIITDVYNGGPTAREYAAIGLSNSGRFVFDFTKPVTTAVVHYVIAHAGAGSLSQLHFAPYLDGRAGRAGDVSLDVASNGQRFHSALVRANDGVFDSLDMSSNEQTLVGRNAICITAVSVPCKEL